MSLFVGLCLLWLAGCATQPAKPAPGFSSVPGAVAHAPDSPTPEQNDALKAAAAAPVAAFEGEGWEPLSDGRNLVDVHRSFDGDLRALAHTACCLPLPAGGFN